MKLTDYTTQELHAEIRRRMGTDRLSTRAIQAGEEAVRKAALHFGVEESTIMGREKSQAVSRARHMAISLMWQAGYSHDYCGRFFKLERTTIYKAVKKTGAKRFLIDNNTKQQ